MNLTDNALRKLQQEGLFVDGPRQQPPPDAPKPTPLNEDDSAVEAEAKQETPEATPAPSVSHPAIVQKTIESVHLPQNIRAQTTETEHTEPTDSADSPPVDELPRPEQSAYDPVIPSFEGTPLSEQEEQLLSEQQPENSAATSRESIGFPEQLEEVMNLVERVDDSESVERGSDRESLADEDELLVAAAPSNTFDPLEETFDPLSGSYGNRLGESGDAGGRRRAAGGARGRGIAAGRRAADRHRSTRNVARTRRR